MRLIHKPIFLLVSLMSLSPVLAPSSVAQEIKSRSEVVFEIAYKRLKEYYKDDIVSETFDKYRNDLKAFPESSERFATDHSSTNFGAYRLAVTDARNGNWEKARDELAQARIPLHWNELGSGTTGSEPNMPDILLLSAIANKATSRNEESIADLKALFLLHKNSMRPWNEDSEFFGKKTEKKSW